MSASVSDIRACFPAMSRKHNGRDVAYFDGPGGTQVPRVVAEAMTDYLYHHNANTHWAYPTSAETDALLAGARSVMAAFVNGRADEVAFGANMTTLTFHLSRALGRGWGPGDEVVITELDHHANVAPWQALAKERGITIRSVRLDPATGRLDMEDFARAITTRCRLLAIGAASNALGTISDVRMATELAHAAGALVYVDAVHYAPHRLVDVQHIDCDFLGCSPYKFYGPHIGMLWARASLLEHMDVPKLIPAPDEGGEKMETGTQNHEGIIGAAAAVGFIASLGDASATGLDSARVPDHVSIRSRLESAYARMHERADAQVERLWNGLGSHARVTLYGPTPQTPRTSTVSFTVDGITSTDVARRLADDGLFVSHGDFYASTVIERLGLGAEGLVRIGCSCYNTDQEVERLADSVARMTST